MSSWYHSGDTPDQCTLSQADDVVVTQGTPQWYPGNHKYTYVPRRLPGYHWGLPKVTMTPSALVSYPTRTSPNIGLHPTIYRLQWMWECVTLTMCNHLPPSVTHDITLYWPLAGKRIIVVSKYYVLSIAVLSLSNAPHILFTLNVIWIVKTVHKHNSACYEIYDINRGRSICNKWHGLPSRHYFMALLNMSKKSALLSENVLLYAFHS